MYFDKSGAFLGLTTETDTQGPTCKGRSYWPHTIVCKRATVSTVYCGNAWAEGDAIDVPFANGVDP